MRRYVFVFVSEYGAMIQIKQKRIKMNQYTEKQTKERENYTLEGVAWFVKLGNRPSIDSVQFHVYDV